MRTQAIVVALSLVVIGCSKDQEASTSNEVKEAPVEALVALTAQVADEPAEVAVAPDRLEGLKLTAYTDVLGRSRSDFKTLCIRAGGTVEPDEGKTSTCTTTLDETDKVFAAFNDDRAVSWSTIWPTASVAQELIEINRGLLGKENGRYKENGCVTTGWIHKQQGRIYTVNRCPEIDITILSVGERE